MQKNMSVTLGSYYEDFINQVVEEGRYATASETIRAGLALLKEHVISQKSIESEIGWPPESAEENNAESSGKSVELSSDQQSELDALPTKSAKIRYLDQQHFSRSQIASLLGIRYQHVRNVLVAG